MVALTGWGKVLPLSVTGAEKKRRDWRLNLVVKTAKRMVSRIYRASLILP